MRSACPGPGVTRTVKDMEARMVYLTKQTSSLEDGRVTYLTITEAGRAAFAANTTRNISASLVPALEVIPEEDVGVP